MLSLYIFIIGILIGSFLNVVILRYRQENFSIVKPARSFCPSCENTLGALELIPIFSFLWQKGRCKHCQTSISWQYPLVELATGILSVATVLYFGFEVKTAFYLALLYTLIPLFMIDVKYQLLPDNLTLPLMWLGLVFQMNFGDLQNGVIGAMAGYLTLWSIYWGFKLISKKEGMGYGDFKLSAAIGAWLGWQALPSVFLIAALLGIVFFIISRQVGKQIAFGPFLIIAFIFAIF